MSSIQRIISGSSAGLVRNFFQLGLILISLPLYLSFWSLELYGIWILIISIISFIKLPITNYLEYLGHEFLRNGPKNRLEISKIIYGSVFMVVLINFFLIVSLYKKIKNLTNWKPRTELDNGLKKTIKWIRDNYSEYSEKYEI